jgi:hypothetical protein
MLAMAAGYSGTPLPQKLGIREGHQIALIGAPPDFADTLGELPLGVSVAHGLAGLVPFDVILLFTMRQAELQKSFLAAAVRLATAGGLWVAWPKKSAGFATDVTESSVRQVGLASGLVDNKVCAIDEIWSGLRFVVRLKDRVHREQGETTGAP